MSENGPTNEEARPGRSRRNHDQLRASVTAWLGARPGLSDVEVVDFVIPESNGMSSETVLVTAEWTEDGERRNNPLVFRLAPESGSVPVFESYDLESQFRTMIDVARLCDIPVPKAIWFEGDPEPVGSPFFVMERCDGEIPPDVLPYNFGDSFLFNASAEQQAALQDKSVGLLAKLHSIPDPVGNFPYIARTVGVGPTDSCESALRAHVGRLRRHYEYVVSDGDRSPLMEQAFEWIEGHLDGLTLEGEPVLLWGDSRIGNVIYRDFEPVGVLDWEMATIGPRELDLSWMIFMHQFFQDVANQIELPGMPDFMRHDDVVALYEELSGHRPQHMDFFAVVCALQHGIIMSQIGRRSIAFGAAERPEDMDDLIMHRRLLVDYMA